MNSKYRYYKCSCFLPNHFVHLSLEEPIDEYDMCVTLGICSFPKTYWQRIIEAWAVLRGKRESYDEVVLDLDQAELLFHDIGDQLEMMQRVHPDDRRAL